MFIENLSLVIARPVSGLSPGNDLLPLGRHAEDVEMTNAKFSMTNSQSSQPLKSRPRQRSTQKSEMHPPRPLFLASSVHESAVHFFGWRFLNPNPNLNPNSEDWDAIQIQIKIRIKSQMKIGRAAQESEVRPVNEGCK